MENQKVQSVFSSQIEKFGVLNKQIKISPKSHLCFNKAGFKIEYMTETVQVTIGIGNDEVAHLIMSKKAYEDLQAGAEVTVTTQKEFKEKYF